MMRYVFILLCLVCIGLNTSCTVIEAMLSDDDENCVSHCGHFKPHEGRVHIEVTINSLNPEVSIEIYYGDIEDHDLMEERILTEENLKLTLPNGAYSVRATYKVNLDGEIVTVFAVDGDELEPDDYLECGDICYDEGDINLDATLVSIRDV